MNCQKCYIGSICYELGKQRDISQLPFFNEAKDLLGIFKARGLESYAESHLRPFELLEKVLGESIRASGIDPKTIDVVVVATDSFWDEASFSRSEMNKIMNTLGLINAYPIGISMMECTSSSIALQVATSLLNTGSVKNILVACTNKVKQGNDNERIIQPGISILSDGAVATLVSSQHKQEFSVLSVDQFHASELQNLNPEENFEDFVSGSIKGFVRASEKSFARLGITSSDINCLITNNYLPHIVMMFAEKIGFKRGDCYFKNIARFAHAHTADTLINLKDALNDGEIVTRNKVMLLSNSPTSWGSVVLEKV